MQNVAKTTRKVRTMKEGIMGWTKALLFVGGAVAAGVVNVASKSSLVRRAAVNVTAKALDASDAIQATTQNIVDEAEDVRAEAERQRKISAALAARMAEYEDKIRDEIIDEVDGKKKPASRSTRSKK